MSVDCVLCEGRNESLYGMQMKVSLLKLFCRSGGQLTASHREIPDSLSGQFT